MKREESDLLRNVAIGTTMSIPCVGGTLGFLLDKSIPDHVSNQYISFIKELESKIIELNCNYDRFKSPEFFSLFIKILNEIILDHIEEKKVLYRNMLLNTLTDSWDLSTNDFFYHITISLNVTALNYLFLLYRGNGDISALKMPELLREYPDQRDYLTSSITELVRFKLVRGTALTNLGTRYCNFCFSPIQLFPTC